jgi:enediyne biosynthesis protein E5
MRPSSELRASVAPTSQPQVLRANTAEWSRRLGDDEDRSPELPVFFRTPKGQLLGIFLLLLGISAPAEGGLAPLANVCVAILAAFLVDMAYTYWERRRWINPTSALLSGMIVAFILGPQEPLQVVAWVAGFASVSKHVFATDREHVFNLAALALVGSVLLFSTGQSWWGALGDLSALWIVVLLIAGAFIVDRLNKFALVLTFLGTYFGAFAMASIIDVSAVAEMFRPPFVQSSLFLAFFMLTDPPTSPNRVGDQVWYGLIAALVAVASQLLGAGQTFLLLGVLAANVWLAVRRWWLRRPKPMTAPEVRRARREALSKYGAVPVRVAAGRYK